MIDIDGPEAVGSPALILSSGAAAIAAYRSFFEESLRNAHTRRAYRRAAEDFFGWCRETACVASLADVGEAHLETWRRQRSEQLAPATARQHLGALRALFRWFAQCGIANDPTIAFRPASAPPPTKPTAKVTREHVAKLLESIDPSTPDGARDRALVAIVAELHLAVGQVIGLRCSDVRQVDDQVYLTIKEPPDDETSWLVRLSSSAAVEIRSLLLVHPNSTDFESPLFTSMPRGTRRLGRSGLAQADVFRLLQRRSRAAGLHPTVSPRALAAARTDR